MQSLPRIATMASMPSRQNSLQTVVESIHQQVDHMFVYLDGYESAPDFLGEYENITVSHCSEKGNFHCSTRFLCLREISKSAVIVVVDDDIQYPPDYVNQLVGFLDKIQGRGIVGVHGRIFLPPHESYRRDSRTIHFTHKVNRPHHVHILGAGTIAFVNDVYNPSPTGWTRHDMDDIFVSLDAQNLGLPRIVIARDKNWLKPLTEGQEDSLYKRLQSDETIQTKLMKKILSSY